MQTERICDWSTNCYIISGVWKPTRESQVIFWDTLDHWTARSRYPTQAERPLIINLQLKIAKLTL